VGRLLATGWPARALQMCLCCCLWIICECLMHCDQGWTLAPSCAVIIWLKWLNAGRASAEQQQMAFHVPRHDLPLCGPSAPLPGKLSHYPDKTFHHSGDAVALQMLHVTCASPLLGAAAAVGTGMCVHGACTALLSAAGRLYVMGCWAHSSGCCCIRSTAPTASHVSIMA
jgi:hypothetical protein